MNDDNRVFISDSLKDLIDLDQKEEVIIKKEIANGLKQEIICEIKTFSNFFVGVLTEYSKKKNKIKLKLAINSKAFTFLLLDQIQSIEIKSLYDIENYLYKYDTENYNVLYSIKYKSENIYILNLEIKEYNDHE
jgi:hypothetical protein